MSRCRGSYTYLHMYMYRHLVYCRFINYSYDSNLINSVAWHDYPEVVNNSIFMIWSQSSFYYPSKVFQIKLLFFMSYCTSCNEFTRKQHRGYVFFYSLHTIKKQYFLWRVRRPSVWRSLCQGVQPYTTQLLLQYIKYMQKQISLVFLCNLDVVFLMLTLRFSWQKKK